MTTGHATSWAEWVDSGQWNSSSDTAMPMLPALAGDVMTLALDPDVSVLRIARVISKEQVLATRVLRLANSALFAQRTPVTNLDRACLVADSTKIAKRPARSLSFLGFRLVFR